MQILLAVGTETHGSVLHPAGHAGVVGLKPTVGLTSRSGVIGGSHNRDSVGSFARNVKDAALLLDALWGGVVDENDPYAFTFLLFELGLNADNNMDAKV